MCSFIHLAALCSAVIIFQNRVYTGDKLHQLLLSENASNVDLYILSAEDLPFVPASFIRAASGEQWDKLKAFPVSAFPPGKSQKALSERLSKDPRMEKDAEQANLLSDFTYTPVIRKGLAEPKGSWRGPDLMKNRNIKLYTILTLDLTCDLYRETETNFANDLRTRAFNILMGKYAIPSSHRRLLQEWAQISVVWPYGLHKTSPGGKLIAMFRRITIFSPDSQHPTDYWVKLIKEIKQANLHLWSSMLKSSHDRLLNDPACFQIKLEMEPAEVLEEEADELDLIFDVCEQGY